MRVLESVVVLMSGSESALVLSGVRAEMDGGRVGCGVWYGASCVAREESASSVLHPGKTEKWVDPHHSGRLARPGRFELPTCGLGNRKPTAEVPVFEPVTNASGTSPAETPAPAQQANRCESVRELATDPNLVLVVGAWATLPGPLKAAILAMIRGALDEPSAPDGKAQRNRGPL